jgi:uncharacterized paraquat-inducible protein A
MTVGELLFLYVSTLLAGITVLAIWREFRRRQFGPAATEDHVFRCHNCSCVYTDDADVDRSRCPQCGQTNDAFRF